MRFSVDPDDTIGAARQSAVISLEGGTERGHEGLEEAAIGMTASAQCGGKD